MIALSLNWLFQAEVNYTKIVKWRFRQIRGKLFDISDDRYVSFNKFIIKLKKEKHALTILLNLAASSHGETRLSRFPFLSFRLKAPSSHFLHVLSSRHSVILVRFQISDDVLATLPVGGSFVISGRTRRNNEHHFLDVERIVTIAGNDYFGDRIQPTDESTVECAIKIDSSFAPLFYGDWHAYNVTYCLVNIFRWSWSSGFGAFVNTYYNRSDNTSILVFHDKNAPEKRGQSSREYLTMRANYVISCDNYSDKYYFMNVTEIPA